MAKPKPTSITLNKKEHYLEITWGPTDTVCRYPLSELREACPCVECRGEHQNMGMAHAPDNLLELKPARSYGINTIEPVGNYALMPVWDDGHATGIYTWEYLWHICPEKPSDDT